MSAKRRVRKDNKFTKKPKLKEMGKILQKEEELLQNDPIEDPFGDAPESVFEQLLSAKENIKIQAFKINGMDEIVAGLQHKRIPTKKLDLDGYISPKSLRQLAEFLQQDGRLEKLKVDTSIRFWQDNDEHVQILARCLSGHPTLAKLGLCFSMFGVEGAKALGKALQTVPHLKKLTVISSVTAKGTVKELCQGLKGASNLKKLTLGRVAIGREDAEGLAQLGSVQHLAIGDLVEAEVKELCEALVHNTTLKVLQMQTTCNDTENGDKAAVHIREMLKANSNLPVLNLFHNHFTTEGARSIAEGLKHNTSLKHLILAKNPIGNEGAHWIAQALRQNSSLESLDLRKANISDEGIKEIFQALSVNSSLKSLNLSSCSITEESTMELALWSLTMNDSLVHLGVGVSPSLLLHVPLLFFLADCNEKWSSERHREMFPEFQACVLGFLLCLKALQREGRIREKIPKFVLFEIIKRINRKLFLPLVFLG